MTTVNLSELAKKPIGSPELQSEADHAAKLIAREGKRRVRLCPELEETIKRTSKLWLPEGKRTARDQAAKDAEKAFYERQTDIEDAVEAAGGTCGGRLAND